jgi:hypothetical protein
VDLAGALEAVEAGALPAVEAGLGAIGDDEGEEGGVWCGTEARDYIEARSFVRV